LIFRAIVLLILFSGLSFAMYMVSGCSGLGCISLLFIGQIALGLTLMIYIFLYILQQFKKI
jgi:hypothetical protein